LTLVEETLLNVLLMLLCYTYVLLVIVVSGRLEKVLNVSQKTSRKFLHIMIGNLPFIIPFFSIKVFPALVAAPFIVVTFLATPYSRLKSFKDKMKGLSVLTEEGHHWGLVFYAISYTCLALLFSDRAYIVAAGILPMAYGDAAASIVGEKHGKHSYKLVAKKSVEGSLAMFLVTLATMCLGMMFFAYVYHFSFLSKGLAILAASVFVTLIEAFSPMGFDNLTVPAFSVLVFLLFGGGT
jgi:phytol kinase